MNINISNFWNDYHVISYEEGNVVSCYRDTEVVIPITKDANMGSDPTIWGPQFTMKVETEEIDGRTRIVCYHNVKQTDDGWICTKCDKYLPANIDKTKAYKYLDTIKYDKGDKFNEDNNYWDWVIEETQNPELINKGFRRRMHDLDNYDTYNGLLPEVKDEFWTENVKASYVEDMNDDPLDGGACEIPTVIGERIFSKDKTEITKELLNFWGYPKKKSDRMTDDGYSSVIWTAVRFSREKAINRVVEMKENLTPKELEWLREILGDKNIALPWYIKNLVPNPKQNIKDRMEWLYKSREFIMNHPNHTPPTPKKGRTMNYINNVIRKTYIGAYTRKDGVKVKAHYRNVTKKCIIAWKNNLSKIKEPKFTSFSWTKIESYKYKGEFFYSLKGRMKGEEVECHRVGKTRNWITNMTTIELNEFLAYAKTQLVK